jgi:hypothetical protein
VLLAAAEAEHARLSPRAEDIVSVFAELDAETEAVRRLAELRPSVDPRRQLRRDPVPRSVDVERPLLEEPQRRFLDGRARRSPIACAKPSRPLRPQACPKTCVKSPSGGRSMSRSGSRPLTT